MAGNIKHGFAKRGAVKPEYRAWLAMHSRCSDPKNPIYHRYGGRGIRVCNAWLKSFSVFLKDMGPRPSRLHTLERRNNNGDYTPGNCYWATYREQENNRADNVLLTFNGQTKTLSQWAELTGINRRTITHRIKRGISVSVALTMPVTGRGRASSLYPAKRRAKMGGG